MAYETTYSSLLADQEDLINKFSQVDFDVDQESNYDLDNANTTTPKDDDYQMYKDFYDTHQATEDLDETDDDLSFLDFVFEGDNKYKSFTPSINTGFNGYTGNVSQSSKSLKDTISGLESGGNYKAESKNSSAKGKYQFIWSIHNKDIAKVTGAKTKDEFLNNPQAQEKYFDYWDQTTLTPSAKVNLSTFQKYYPNATEDDVKKATHFAGRGNLEKALKTGNFSQGIDANNTSISKYVFGNKKAYGGYNDDKNKFKSDNTRIDKPFNTLAISSNYEARLNGTDLSQSPNIQKINNIEENNKQLELRKQQGYTTGTGETNPIYPEVLLFPGTPTIKGLGKLGNFALDALNPTSGLLSHSYKYNPLAFKPDPEAFYRRIGGEKGLNDILESGLVRPNQNVIDNFIPGTKINLSKKYKDEDAYFSKGVPFDGRYGPENQIYEGPYMVESKNTPFIGKVNGKLKESDSIGVPANGKPLTKEQIKIYKEHWLKGYVPVKK